MKRAWRDGGSVSAGAADRNYGVHHQDVQWPQGLLRTIDQRYQVSRLAGIHPAG